jgi:hypothetical protein
MHLLVKDSSCALDVLVLQFFLLVSRSFHRQRSFANCLWATNQLEALVEHIFYRMLDRFVEEIWQGRNSC